MPTASLVSTPSRTACAIVERTKAACSSPGTFRSSKYSVRPARMPGSSRRRTGFPRIDPDVAMCSSAPLARDAPGGAPRPRTLLTGPGGLPASAGGEVGPGLRAHDVDEVAERDVAVVDVQAPRGPERVAQHRARVAGLAHVVDLQPGRAGRVLAAGGEQ